MKTIGLSAFLRLVAISLIFSSAAKADLNFTNPSVAKLKMQFDQSPYAKWSSLMGKSLLGICKVYQSNPPSSRIFSSASEILALPSQCKNKPTIGSCSPSTPRAGLFDVKAGMWMYDSGPDAQDFYTQLLKDALYDLFTMSPAERAVGIVNDPDGESIRGLPFDNIKSEVGQYLTYTLPSINNDLAISYLFVPDDQQPNGSHSMVLTELHVKEPSPGVYIARSKQIFGLRGLNPITAAQKFAGQGFDEYFPAYGTTQGWVCSWFQNVKENN